MSNRIVAVSSPTPRVQPLQQLRTYVSVYCGYRENLAELRSEFAMYCRLLLPVSAQMCHCHSGHVVTNYCSPSTRNLLVGRHFH